ncbi:MAG: ABC transporter permease [Hyalangium sp.]|uniref:ABC transporter permease n=1 Tax=Hyalangium sp. TaxID=2028555 RepID=UPI003899800B
MSLRVDFIEGSRIALFSLRAHKLRTLLTTSGIAIGVATLLAIVGIIQGLDALFAHHLAAMGSNTLFISKQAFGGGGWEVRHRKDFDFKQVEAIRRQSSYATTVAPFTTLQTEVSFREVHLPSVMAVAATEEYLDVSGYTLQSGRFLSQVDDSNALPVVVLGSDVVSTLFPDGVAADATVQLDGFPFRVIGTLAPRGKALVINFDRSVLIPYKTLLSRYGKKRSMQIIVGVDTPENVGAAEDELLGILRRARDIPTDRPDDFAISRPEQLMDLYKKLTGALYGAVLGLGLLTLLVGGVGIMNIMLVTVRERTREIGVRRAMGARRRTIILQFLLEAVVLSAVGGAVGTAVGLGAAKTVAAVSPLEAAVRPLTVLFGVGFAAFVGLLSGIWPAARAARLDPVEALRHE